MTYGVDECRRCGAAMRPRRDNPRADDRRLARLSEARWRAEGWLAQPTRAQQHSPGLGCCMDCVALIHRKRWKPGVRVASMFGAIALFAALIWWLLTIYLP